MNKLAELRKKLADLKGKGLAILDGADREARDLTDIEVESYEKIEAEITETQAAIVTAEANAERRRTMEALPTSAALSNVVHDLDPGQTHGFKSIAEFALAGRMAGAPGGVRDPRLKAAPANTHTGGAATGEGFEVPPQFTNDIFEVVQQLDDIGGLTDEEPTSQREVKTLADESTPWGASGITARWRSEGAPMAPSKAALQPRTVPLHELYAFVQATEELLEDSPRLEARLTRKAGEAIAWKKGDAIINGSGSGQPLGWMNSPAQIVVAKETGQAADTLNATNILKMFSRHLVVPGDKPFWLANQDIVPQLATMTIGDQPIWMPPNGLMDAPGGMLLGRPIKFSEHAKTLGDKGDLQLISGKGYYSLRRDGAAKFARSIHLWFDYGMEAFRWTFRFGGQPHLSAPVEPANGAGTKSHFVALAERG